MLNDDNFSLNISSLYRLSAKFFDNLFSNHDIGFAQLLFLTDIYEHEGISMNDLVLHGGYDKGTVTKSLQKLLELGYIRILTSNDDKRIRLLYTTPICQRIISSLLYEKQKWLNYLCLDLNKSEKEIFLKALALVSKRAKRVANKLEQKAPATSLHFFGLQKVSLASYPPHISSLLYVVGSNFRSPYATESNYLFLNESEKALSTDDVYGYLKLKKGLLDAIVLTGGEPLLYENIFTFLKQVKQLGYLVKIETNGSLFAPLKKVIDEKLVDYVSLNILNSQEKYSISAGGEVDHSSILSSINYLLKGNIDYDFHTTLVVGYHTKLDIMAIAKLIKGAKRYYLDQYDENCNNLRDDLKAFSNEEMFIFLKEVQKEINNVSLRLVKE